MSFLEIQEPCPKGYKKEYIDMDFFKPFNISNADFYIVKII
jgi:hypothetical protein